jgi:hypothetical protein
MCVQWTCPQGSRKACRVAGWRWENYGGKRSFVGTIIQGRIVPRVIAVVRFGSTIPQPENALNGGVEA